MNLASLRIDAERSVRAGGDLADAGADLLEALRQVDAAHARLREALRAASQ